MTRGTPLLALGLAAFAACGGPALPALGRQASPSPALSTSRTVEPPEILFTSEANIWTHGPQRLMGIRPDGSHLRSLGQFPTDVTDVLLGRKLAVYSLTTESNSGTYSGCGIAGCSSNYYSSAEAGIGVSDPTGDRARVLTSGGYDTQPALSPDGSRIAYTRHRKSSAGQESDGLAVMTTAGSGLVDFTPDGYSDDAPTWSPRGDAVAVVRHQVHGQRIDVVIVSLRANQPDRTILTGITDYSALSWSHDGKNLTAAMVRNEPVPGHPGQFYANVLGEDIAVIPVRGGPVRQLTHLAPAELIAPPGFICNSEGPNAMWLGDPAWSPDDRQIAFATNVNHLKTSRLPPNDVMTVDADGNGLRVVYSGSWGPCHGTDPVPSEVVHVTGWVQAWRP